MGKPTWFSHLSGKTDLVFPLKWKKTNLVFPLKWENPHSKQQYLSKWGCRPGAISAVPGMSCWLHSAPDRRCSTHPVAIPAAPACRSYRTARCCQPVQTDTKIRLDSMRQTLMDSFCKYDKSENIVKCENNILSTLRSHK